MRYVDLPRDYYIAYAQGLESADRHEHALVSHLQKIDSPEKPAVLADFLLRYDQVDWVLVTAIYGEKLVLSLRTSAAKPTAIHVVKKLVRAIGQGGGHTTKAGGFLPLAGKSSRDIERLRRMLQNRYLRAVGIKPAKGEMLVPPDSRG
jgi:nanoRNase/pAp phosphatase (c-di-AMP/oligoRNAs hydrolase)